MQELLPYVSEIPAHFIHEMYKTIEYYDIDANLFHRILFMSSRQ